MDGIHRGGYPKAMTPRAPHHGPKVCPLGERAGGAEHRTIPRPFCRPFGAHRCEGGAGLRRMESLLGPAYREMAEGWFSNRFVLSPPPPEEAVRGIEERGKRENGLMKQKHLRAPLLDIRPLYGQLSVTGAALVHDSGTGAALKTIPGDER